MKHSLEEAKKNLLFSRRLSVKKGGIYSTIFFISLYLYVPMFLCHYVPMPYVLISIYPYIPMSLRPYVSISLRPYVSMSIFYVSMSLCP